jgi:predicted RNA-binding Zn-ribbon protein involved in translation (DUF1610 family)
MGLSNGERIEKILYSIKAMQEEADNLKCDYDYGRIKELISDLWVKFFGEKGNAGHWIMGDDLDNSSFDENSWVGIAFDSHTPTTNEINLDEPTGDKFFDAMRTIQDHLRMSVIVNDPERSAIIKIYHHCEHICYAMHRYEDELSASLDGFNKVVRLTQGEIFKIFSEDPEYYHAWLVAQICDKCITYTEHDVVNQWVVKQNMQHKLLLNNSIDYEKLYYMYMKIQFVDCVPYSTRFKMLLFIAGSRYKYPQQRDELIKMVTYHNSVSEDKVDMAQIDKWIGDCMTAKESDLEGDCRHSCYVTGNYKSGKEVSNWKWDHFHKRNVVETKHPFTCPSCNDDAIMEETIDLEEDKKRYECYACGYKIIGVDNIADLETYLDDPKILEGNQEEKVDICLASSDDNPPESTQSWHVVKDNSIDNSSPEEDLNR